MTLRPITASRFPVCLLLLLCLLSAVGQPQSIPVTSGPVLPLYRALRNVGLDSQRVFAIREAALATQADLVVLGRGVRHEAFGRLLSKSYEIIRQSPCPVLSL